MPLNDRTDYGLCFACGPRNPWGLKLTFEQKGDTVVTRFTGRDEYQGFPGMLHGGVIGALLDEVMSRISVAREGRWTMTARMEVRYRLPVPIDEEVTAMAEYAGTSRGLVRATGKLVLPSGAVAAEGTGVFAYVPGAKLAEMTSGFPGLAAEWITESD